MKIPHCKCLQSRLAWAFGLVYALLGFGLATTNQLLAQGASNDTAPATAAQTTWLEYRETKQPLIRWPLVVNPQVKAFPKEPALEGRKVSRGSLQVGDQAKQAVNFLWDYTKGKLYLDLNRNEDLTDDPTGILTLPRFQFSPYYQTFTNVHLTLESANGKRPLLLDLTLYQPNYNGQPNGSAACRSFWQGTIPLQNQDWQIGIVENPPGRVGPVEPAYLLLRPWGGREEPFETQSGCLDAFTFSPNLFFRQQAYAVEGGFDQQGGAPKYRITLREKAVELGELRLTGKFIHRLVLTGNSAEATKDRFTVVLDRPEASVTIPTGTYGPCQIQLKAGSVDAYRDAARLSPSQVVMTVTAKGSKATLLNAGGPLTNTVSAARRGAFLSLSYQLLGADGVPYQLVHFDRNQPPRFNIYKNGKVIQSGRFEFG